MRYSLLENSPEGQFRKAHADDAGYDLMAAETVTLEPGKSALVRTGLVVEIPQGYAGIVKSRSGIASKQDVETGAGVIDSGYRGEVRVLLRNFSEVAVTFERGQRIAQMLVLPCYTKEDVEVPRHVLEPTLRQDKGFGSTGTGKEAVR